MVVEVVIDGVVDRVVDRVVDGIAVDGVVVVKVEGRIVVVSIGILVFESITKGVVVRSVD